MNTIFYANLQFILFARIFIKLIINRDILKYRDKMKNLYEFLYGAEKMKGADVKTYWR